MFPDYNINATTTSQQIQKNDKGINIFLINEELESVDGKAPPMAKKDTLCKFLSLKKQPFIKCFHIIAVNPTAHFDLSQDFHNTVHGVFSGLPSTHFSE